MYLYLVMNRKSIIEKTIEAINKLPENKAEEISVFADFLIKRYEEEQLTSGIQQLTTESDTFQFLAEDEEIYSTKDLKVKYDD